MLEVVLSLVLIFSIGFILFPLLKKSYLKYQRKKQYRHIINEIDGLFSDINPYLLSQNSRPFVDVPASDLVYGEIDLVSLLDLLAIIRPTPNALFYDLGSGCGKPAIAVKLRYPTLKVKGIELLSALYDVSIMKLKEYHDKHALTQKEFDVTFICDNIVNQPFADADIIFINSTAFSPHIWEQILYKLVQLKVGAKIIITSKQLPAPTFKKHYEGMKLMSWGFTSTYIYEKIV